MVLKISNSISCRQQRMFSYVLAFSLLSQLEKGILGRWVYTGYSAQDELCLTQAGYMECSFVRDLLFSSASDSISYTSLQFPTVSSGLFNLLSGFFKG